MLLRHSAYYLLARGVPGLVNFGALAVYTRLLAPDEFGRYALVIAGIGLAHVLLFQWLRLVLARFLQEYRYDQPRFLGGMLAIFLILAIPVTGLGVLLAWWVPDPIWQRLLALAVPLLIAQAWFELNLTLASAGLQPRRYGKLLGAKAVIALGVGGLLAWIGLGAMAPLTGLLAGHVLAFLLFGWITWRSVRPQWPEAALLRDQLRYGMPLTVTFALTWVVSSSDRMLLAWLIGEQAVGVYAAGYELTFQGLTLVLIIINTAAYPLALNVLARHGGEAARRQLRQNGELIIAVALASAAVLVVLGPQLVALLIGEAFREGALLILPWIAVAAAIAGMKSYHFDIAFHLGRGSRWLLVSGVIAAMCNLALNLVLIPAHGILGAAWATLGAYAIALTSSALLGRRSFAMPTAMPLLFKGALIGAGTALMTWLGVKLVEGITLQFSMGLGFAVAGFLVASLIGNLGGLRQAVSHRLERLRAS